MSSRDKERISTILILEEVLDVIIMDAAVVFPINGAEDPVVLKRWADTLKLWVVEAVKRQHVPAQPAFKSLSKEKKVELILEKTAASIQKTMEIQERKTAAATYLEMEMPPGPPPIPPAKADEQPHNRDPNQATDAEQH